MADKPMMAANVRREPEDALPHRNDEHREEHLHRVITVSNEIMARMNRNSRNWLRSIERIARQANRSALSRMTRAWAPTRRAQQSLADRNAEMETTNTHDEQAAMCSAGY
jgi:hypothetical protein